MRRTIQPYIAIEILRKTVRFRYILMDFFYTLEIHTNYFICLWCLNLMHHMKTKYHDLFCKLDKNGTFRGLPESRWGKIPEKWKKKISWLGAVIWYSIHDTCYDSILVYLSLNLNDMNNVLYCYYCIILWNFAKYLVIHLKSQSVIKDSRKFGNQQNFAKSRDW